MVLKDAYTVVIHDGRGYVNSSGNPGMATAGSGDVLTGVITGLIARGYEPLVAATMGVYLHGIAGDLAAHQKGYESMTAGDIIDMLGKAFLELLYSPETNQDKENNGKD